MRPVILSVTCALIILSSASRSESLGVLVPSQAKCLNVITSKNISKSDFSIKKKDAGFGGDTFAAFAIERRFHSSVEWRLWRFFPSINYGMGRRQQQKIGSQQLRQVSKMFQFESNGLEQRQRSTKILYGEINLGESYSAGLRSAVNRKPRKVSWNSGPNNNWIKIRPFKFNKATFSYIDTAFSGAPKQNSRENQGYGSNGGDAGPAIVNTISNSPDVQSESDIRAEDTGWAFIKSIIGLVVLVLVYELLEIF